LMTSPKAPVVATGPYFADVRKCNSIKASFDKHEM
jgi:hypothetical protein